MLHRSAKSVLDEGAFVFARATVMGHGGSALGCAYQERSYASDTKQSEEAAAVQAGQI